MFIEPLLCVPSCTIALGKSRINTWLLFILISGLGKFNIWVKGRWWPVGGSEFVLVFWFSRNGSWAQQLVPVHALWQLINRVNHKNNYWSYIGVSCRNTVKNSLLSVFQGIKNSVFECKFFLLVYIHPKQ